MEEYNYTLIISQYWHSYHYFIVKFNKETFIIQMQELTKELDKRKGGGDGNSHIETSDPFYNYNNGTIRSRYNVNSNGDIYFIQGKYVNYLQQVIQRSISDNRYSQQGFKKKSMLEDISNNHNYDQIFKIIEKYFEIA